MTVNRALGARNAELTGLMAQYPDAKGAAVQRLSDLLPEHYPHFIGALQQLEASTAEGAPS